MPESFTFVLGGSGSGKSAYAESLFAESERALYLATSDPKTEDAEMRKRIAAHRARRSRKWRLLEAPLELPSALRSLRGSEPILIDSVSLWLANLRLASEEQCLKAVGELLAAIRAAAGRLIIVGDECGLGIIPANEVARRFAEFSGILNRRLAAAAAKTILVVVGLPMTIKIK